MAAYDLEEQEQLDQLKAFWKSYGSLISGLLTVVLLGLAAYNGWNLWQRNQAEKASGMFAELEKVAEGGDAKRAAQVFEDLKANYGNTAYAAHGALLAARSQAAQGDLDGASAALRWVADQGSEEEFRAVARLRLAAVLLDQSKADEAAKVLAGAFPTAFEALAADRKGDVLMAQNKSSEALSAYQSALTTMDAKSEYRRLVEAKVSALGVAPAAASAAQGAKP